MVDKTLDRFGRLDVLFANAGIYIPGEAADGNPDDWAHLMDVNIDGVLRSVHAALGPMMQQGSGDILVTSSISGFIDIHWEPVYSASKHAIQAFVHTLRRQVAPHGIRVGAIAPGRVVNAALGLHRSGGHRRRGREAGGAALGRCRRRRGLHAVATAACQHPRSGDAAAQAGTIDLRRRAHHQRD